MHAPVAHAGAELSADKWREHRFYRLLYGPATDRGAKAKARVALAIAAFIAVYALIAARLVMHAVAPDVHVARRSTAQNPVTLALDLRVQHALRDELVAALDKFKAKAAAGLVTDVRTGEVIALVSLPNYDPNNPR